MRGTASGDDGKVRDGLFAGFESGAAAVGDRKAGHSRRRRILRRGFLAVGYRAEDIDHDDLSALTIPVHEAGTFENKPASLFHADEILRDIAQSFLRNFGEAKIP